MSGSLQTNAKDVGQTKLSPALKLQVCQWIGEYWRNNQILEWLQSEHNITLNSSTITYYRTSEDWQEEIQRARSAYNASLEDEWGASVRARMKELQKLYEVAAKDITSPARRAECQRILKQAAEECPDLQVMQPADNFSIEIPEHLAAGVGLVKASQPEELEGD